MIRDEWPRSLSSSVLDALRKQYSGAKLASTPVGIVSGEARMLAFLSLLFCGVKDGPSFALFFLVFAFFMGQGGRDGVEIGNSISPFELWRYCAVFNLPRDCMYASRPVIQHTVLSIIFLPSFEWGRKGRAGLPLL